MQASKWLQLSMLIDDSEMENLLQTLGDFEIYIVSKVVKGSEGCISHEEFLDCYKMYIDDLKNGRMPQDVRIRPYFSSAFTVDKEAVLEMKLSEESKLIKVQKPVLQLQAFRFKYSQVDHKIHQMGLGEDSVQWGIQFSYPQLFQDASFQVKKALTQQEFPNAALFKKVQKWMRDNTVPVPFIIDGQRVNESFRMGKACISWIENHPQKDKFSIYTERN